MATLRHDRLSDQIPKLKQSYTSYLYWGFALVFVVLLVAGFTLF